MVFVEGEGEGETEGIVKIGIIFKYQEWDFAYIFHS